jgi:hypothetical protein
MLGRVTLNIDGLVIAICHWFGRRYKKMMLKGHVFYVRGSHSRLYGVTGTS